MCEMPVEKEPSTPSKFITIRLACIVATVSVSLCCVSYMLLLTCTSVFLQLPASTVVVEGLCHAELIGRVPDKLRWW